MLLPRIVGGLLDLLTPLTCAGCGLPGVAICHECDGRLVRIVPASICERCGHPWSRRVPRCPECPPHIAAARQAVIFADPAPAILHALKDERREELARLIAVFILDLVPPPGPGTTLVPVPITRERLGDRGFNQSGVIAHALSAAWGSSVSEILVRQGDAPPQRGATAAERVEQVRGAFRIGLCETPPSVLLVDDVMTTGATLAACARVLRAGGIRRVGAVAFARVVDGRRL